jgi:flagellar biosynthesis/type III secretory pathway M-ring protein FliF/YscJ
MTAGPLRSRRTTMGLVAILLLAPLAASTAFASTGTVPGDDRAAAVQGVLDRVLGAGNSTVVVADTVRTSSSRTTTVRWGSGAVGSIARNSVVTAAGSSTATVQQNLDGGTTTETATPAGSLVDQSVSVVVDRAHLGSTSLATLRRLVTATAGIVPGRGDRVSVVTATFVKPVPVTVAAVTPLTLLTPYAVPAIWTLGGIVALLILVLAFRRRRPARPGTDVQRA